MSQDNRVEQITSDARLNPECFNQSHNNQSLGQYQQHEISESMRSRADNYDMDAAIADLNDIINKSSEFYYQLKKMKFDYLTNAFDMYTKIDLPSVMMTTCQKNASESVPKVKDINDINIPSIS